ncbi:unnamed protein product [Rhodiola kirilowii]
MKRKYMMLSLLISGPRQPENDIDVYLASLIDDLKLYGTKEYARLTHQGKNISICVPC